MKVLNLSLLLFLLAGVCSAQALQSSADAPGVAVLEKSWRSELRNPALDEDPLQANREQRQQERDVKQNQTDNIERARLGLPQEPPPSTRLGTPPTSPPGRPYVEYIYQAKVRNDGAKAISKLVWEYVFFDPATQREVGRRRSESKVNIRPSKVVTLLLRSLFPPTGTVNAAQASKKQQEQYSEQIVIQRIEYTDGSVWQREAN